jgi:hypothetical protein
MRAFKSDSPAQSKSAAISTASEHSSAGIIQP